MRSISRASVRILARAFCVRLSNFTKMDATCRDSHDVPEKRGKPWEAHEVQALCHFIRANRSRLFGTGGRGSLGVEKEKATAWEECKAAVVAAGGRRDRSWEKMRKKWQDLASKAKKYNTLRKEYLNGTGGGGFVPPNEQYELVLQALPDELRDGITPFGSTETAPSVVSGVRGPATLAAHPGTHKSVEALKQVPATLTTSPQRAQQNFKKQVPATVTVVSATLSSPQGAQQNSRKRPVIRMDTETEDSQESKDGKKKKKMKGKKVQKKRTDEVDLLTLNKSIAASEKRKVELMDGILMTLQGIHTCLQRLTAAPQDSAIDLLTGMQAEQ